MVTIVSSWGPSGASLYGERFMRQAAESWGSDITFLLYLEETAGVYPTSLPPNILVRPFFDTAWTAWSQRIDQPQYKGKGPERAKLKSHEIEAGYSYRWDAWKFSRKVFALADAADNCNDDFLIWLDGDTVVRPGKFIDGDWLTGIIDGAHICYLGRERPHSETSFLSFDKHAMRTFPAEMRAVYTTMVFENSDLGWTDSDVFDYVRLSSFFMFRNLTRGEPRGAVFERSQLGARLEHLKGNRKERYAG